MKALKSWIAIVQFVAICQMFIGLSFAPMVLHSGGAQRAWLIGQINDASIREGVQRQYARYEGQMADIGFVMSGFGLATLLLSTVVSFYAGRAATRLRAELSQSAA